MATFYSGKWREEQLKNAVAKDWFDKYDSTRIIGNIDFCVAKPKDSTKGRQMDLWSENELIQPFLWAESKAGNKHDIYESFVQLVITIGKARTFESVLPPVFLGAFDAEKIAFIPYEAISDIFVQNDFNWKVTPSDHSTKEFKFVLNKVKAFLQKKSYIFYYERDSKELKRFINDNFKLGRFGDKLLQITRNNFNIVYLKWLKTVKPTINVDWEKLKQADILDADFYLADLLSKNDESIKDSLFVLLKKNAYIFNKKINELGLETFSTVTFKDDQRAYKQFWNVYDRPPRKEFWDYIINRRDLLVPQDVRERKGSFFTPEPWVNLSQQYLADALGDNWQDEYYIWDCCAGTGNLLKGLQNKGRIWASTLDQADVDVMKDQIKNNNAPLYESHVFQMDFLNDKFEDKCPKSLLDVINNPEKRKKLVIYINPPYAETGTVSQAKGTGQNKKNLTQTNKVYEKYKDIMGKARMELFALFFIRIQKELGGCILGGFSKLKILQAPNFKEFRKQFNPLLKKMFVVPGNTFDNVKGRFPIGFCIWNTGIKEEHSDRTTDVYSATGEFLFQKNIHCPGDNEKLIGEWLKTFKDKSGSPIGMMNSGRNDFQNQNFCYIANIVNDKAHALTLTLTNIIPACVFLAVRHCIPATWLNDRDSFFYPQSDWEQDKDFQSDCLAFSLFSGQNGISSEQGINHWIPFTEEEVGARDEFESHFMTDYIQNHNIAFTPKARTVFDAGRELWKYYHKQPMANPNASFNDIRAYFQGRKENGKMNAKSDDKHYTVLIGNLRQALKELADQIKPKVYQYRFLV